MCSVKSIKEAIVEVYGAESSSALDTSRVYAVEEESFDELYRSIFN